MAELNPASSSAYGTGDKDSNWNGNSDWNGNSGWNGSDKTLPSRVQPVVQWSQPTLKRS